MAKNSKAGKTNKNDEKLIKEDKDTSARNDERHEGNVKVEAEKAEVAKEESENQAPPVAVANVPEKKRKGLFNALLEDYEKENPVKFAAKKKRGEFDNIPDTFTGRNQLNITS